MTAIAMDTTHAPMFLVLDALQLKKGDGQSG